MPIAKRFLILTLLLYFSHAVNAIASPRPLSDRAMRVWTTDDGLPHNSINHISQDSRGYLWISTWEGPVRFNGRNFLLYFDEVGVPDPGTLFIGENPYTREIVSTGARGGVAYFRHSSDGGHWRSSPRVYNRVDFALFTSPSCTWFGTVSSGVVRECDGQRTTFDSQAGLPSDAVLQLSQDASDRVWAGTDRGIAYFDAAQQRFVGLAALPKGYSFGIVPAQDGFIYATVDRQVFQIEPESLLVTPWPVTYPSTITELYQSADGVIWVGTHEHGLTTLTREPPQMTSVENGLPNNHILSIFMDREGILWVGTHRGLIQFRAAQFHSHRNEDGLGYDYVRALTELPDGSVLVGGLGGVKRITDEVIEPYAATSNVANESVLSFATDAHQRLYVGTFTNGLYVLQNEQELVHYDETSNFSEGNYRDLVIARDGYLYAATSIGVMRSKMNPDGTLEPPDYLNKQSGLPDEIIYALHEANNGDLWIGSMRGLSVFRDGKVERVDLSSVSDAEFIFGFHEDLERLYVTSDRGLLVYTKSTEQWQLFDSDNGFPVIKFFDVVRDNNGDVWLASGRGLLFINNDEFERALFDDNPTTPIASSFYKGFHGLASAQINTGGPAMLVTSSDELWVATSRGVGHYLPQQSSQIKQTPPRPVIEKVAVDGQAITPNTYLSANAGRIEFYFAGLGYHYPEGIAYRAMLAGYDEDWYSVPLDRLSVAYTELPPGAFIFEIQAAYPDGTWSDAATFTFHKLPTLWQRPMYWFAVAVGLCIAVFLIIRLRVYNLARSKARLQELVREQTASLQQLAHQDSLTKLANRRAFDELLKHKIRQHDGHSTLALVLMDLDHFKAVNDRYLHTTGDKVLQRIARVLSDSARDCDMIARWGGEEFAILISTIKSTDVPAFAERLRETIRATDMHELVADFNITASFGVAILQSDETAASLIRRADKALYQAKAQGRDCVIMSTD